jgi:hypothetical protein
MSPCFGLRLPTAEIQFSLPSVFLTWTKLDWYLTWSYIDQKWKRESRTSFGILQSLLIYLSAQYFSERNVTISRRHFNVSTILRCFITSYQAVTLQTCHGSNLDLATNCNDWMLPWFSSVHSENLLYRIMKHAKTDSVHMLLNTLFTTHTAFRRRFCLRLQVKPTQLGSIDRASPYLRTPAAAESSLQNFMCLK